jgi:adenine-specific DNA-methyltransferase
LQMQLGVTEPDLQLPQNLGGVYTPPFLAEWVAQELLSCFPPDIRPVILDPACGDGILLTAVRTVATRPVALEGIDIDPSAIDEARARLGTDVDLKLHDALLSPLDALANGSASGVIANPPWGADLSHSKESLRQRGYQLARGQCDSFELFVERCVHDAKPGTPMAFIIPDSIFLPEHEPLRRLLLEKCSLLLVARLGEGFFQGVFRGTVVVVLTVGTPEFDHEVACMRLPADVRKKVLHGIVRLDVAKRMLVHRVPQERFLANPKAELNIDARVEESNTLQRFEVRPLDWSRWVRIGRGVELGKSGLVVPCLECGEHRPIPRKSERVSCKQCGTRLDLTRREPIIRNLSESDTDGWWPLIVGEDVDRYACAPSREIKRYVPGIQYKPHAVFTSRKLLVRKTGIGLKAAIDESGAYTTQVVFHFIAQDGAPDFMLDYIQGVLCSRVMLAYHLQVSGESQWRSHPYVTPKVLTQLPIPDPTGDVAEKAEQIARAVREVAPEPSRDADLRIERLVVELYRLQRRDCHWVARSLENAQSLASIAPLRIDATDLLPVRGSGNGLSVYRQ